MTLREEIAEVLLRDEFRDAVTDELVDAILSKIVETLPKEREIHHSEQHPYTIHNRVYNQALKDVRQAIGEE